MRRIAIISDLHGNMPALTATIEDIKRRNIDQIYCLGDLVGKGPHSDRTVDLCRELCTLTVKGNWDDYLVTKTDHPIARWHQERLGPERLKYLAELPHTIDFMMSGKQIRLFHASEQGIYHRVAMDAPLERQAEMFSNTDFTGHGAHPTVVGYGDIHRSYVKSFDQRLLFNVGSVGNPLDLPQAAYAVLEGEYGSSAAAGFAIQLIRVPYDIEQAIRDAQEAHMPDLQPYTDELRTARYRGAPKAQ